MTRIRRTRERSRDESGHTLVELMVATMLLLSLMVASFVVARVVQSAQPKVTFRAAQIQRGQTMAERLTRELRQGYAVVGTATPSQLTFQTWVRRTACGGAPLDPSDPSPAIRCQVSYTCTAGVCTRTEQPPGGGGGSSVELVRGLSSSTPFSCTPSCTDPEYIGVRLVLPAPSGDDAVTIEDGVNLRNATRLS